MNKGFAILAFLVLTSSLIISCAIETGPQVDLPLTGSPTTLEWTKYNTQAELKGVPLLMYAVTAKELARTKPEEPRRIQDTFSVEDERVYVYTRWTNIRGRPRYHIRIYDPRDSVFYEGESEYSFGTGLWNIWNVLRVKGWPASRLPGKWRAEILMNDSLALRKEFVIGSTVQRYEPRVVKEEAPTIGVHPYFVDAETSHRDNSTLLPLYISQMLMVEFDKYRVVTPFQLRREMVRPVAKFAEYGNLIMRELKSPTSQWNRVASKYKMDLLIAGAVYDSAQYEYEKKATIYLIDTKTKAIRQINANFKSMRAHERSGADVIANFYGEIYVQMAKQGAEVLRIDK